MIIHTPKYIYVRIDMHTSARTESAEACVCTQGGSEKVAKIQSDMKHTENQ